ncbi:transposase [Candidatus Aerophobetes bacterium]|nr:transposase [Candidatus Aerophobetes bacterium]
MIEDKDISTTSEKIILAYRHKEQIENAFKNIKSFLKIRPFYVNLDDHVEAVYTICILAYFINRYLAHKRKEHEGKDFLNSEELYAPFSSCKLVTLKNNISGELRRKIIPLERYQIALLKSIGLEHLAMTKLPKNLSQVKPM